MDGISGLGALPFETDARALANRAAVAGTLEEQFGYVVVVSCVPALACAARDLYDRGQLRRVLSVSAALFLVTTAVLGVLARSAHDDGFRRVRAWMPRSSRTISSCRPCHHTQPTERSYSAAPGRRQALRGR